MERYCKNCGMGLDDDDVFCRNCGSKTDLTTVLPQPQPPNMTTSDWVLTVVVTLFLPVPFVGLIFAIIWAKDKKQPQVKRTYCKIVAIIMGVYYAVCILIFLFLFAIFIFSAFSLPFVFGRG